MSALQPLAHNTTIILSIIMKYERMAIAAFAGLIRLRSSKRAPFIACYPASKLAWPKRSMYLLWSVGGGRFAICFRSEGTRTLARTQMLHLIVNIIKSSS